MPTPIKINPPFRADHMGSLLRPRERIEAFHSFPAGQLTEEAFREVQDRSIRDA